ncbi:hypothetical protein F7P82_10125 [Acinetobacter guillouiae]|nr:hypothetical protein F7P82_10125 [Acinetobacter guillouiae]
MRSIASLFLRFIM